MKKEFNKISKWILAFILATSAGQIGKQAVIYFRTDSISNEDQFTRSQNKDIAEARKILEKNGIDLNFFENTNITNQRKELTKSFEEILENNIELKKQLIDLNISKRDYINCYLDEFIEGINDLKKSGVKLKKGMGTSLSNIIRTECINILRASKDIINKTRSIQTINYHDTINQYHNLLKDENLKKVMNKYSDKVSYYHGQVFPEETYILNDHIDYARKFKIEYFKIDKSSLIFEKINEENLKVNYSLDYNITRKQNGKQLKFRLWNHLVFDPNMYIISVDSEIIWRE